MKKKHIKQLNNNAFSLVEIVLAISLATIAIVAIGAIIISTRSNTTNLLTDTQLQQQLNLTKEALSNEISTTNAGIKYWVKQSGDELAPYVTTINDVGNDYDKLIAFYKVDANQDTLIKTYYLYDSQDKLLQVATVDTAMPNNSDVDQIDADIQTTIDEITGWDTIAINIASLNVDFSRCQTNRLVTFSIEIEQNNSAYPTQVSVMTRFNIDVNGALNIDPITNWVGGLVVPPRARVGLMANGDYQTLVIAGSADYETMYYKVGENGTWSENLPSEKYAGTYKVYFYVYGDQYYTEDNANSYVTVTILPAD